MRSNDNWNEDDDLDFDNQGGDETERKNPLRKVNNALEKRVKELTEKLEKFERQEKESVVSKVLESKGVTSKAARLILKDLDEVNEESVSNWLEDNGDMFGYKPQVEEPVTNQNVREFSRQDGITQGATTPDASDDYIEMLQNYNGDSEEELRNIFKNIAVKQAN